MFLISSFGLSGSKYISDYFKKCGYDVLHEEDGAIGCSSWWHLFEHIDVQKSLGIAKYDKIIHLVRNPLEVARSFPIRWTESGCQKLYGYMTRYYYEQDKSIPIYKEPMKNFMEAWFQYNQLISKWSIWRFKIEEFQDKKYILFNKLGLEFPDKKPRMKPQNEHSKRFEKGYLKDLTINDLKKYRDVFPKFSSLAKMYGYDL